MKVFLSWSGELSHQIACIFKDWLPNVLQFVIPYVSSEDIDKGARWSIDIAKELEESHYGILMITDDNANSSWINFEAGALSKTLDKSKVAPFLFNIKRAELQGPLIQFQSTIYEKEELFKLINSINKSAHSNNQLNEIRIENVFEKWWPELNTKLNMTLQYKAKANISKKDTSEILEEILELSRTQLKTISSPDTFLPPKYLRKMFGIRTFQESEVIRLKAHEQLSNTIKYLEKLCVRVKSKKTKLLTKYEIMELEDYLMNLKSISKTLGQDLEFSQDILDL